MVNINTSLFNEVKSYLDITWDDEQTNLKLLGIIERGMRYLDKVAGAKLGYTVNDQPKELLLDYCRYVRSHALEMFQHNYLHELLSLQIDAEVGAYKKIKATLSTIADLKDDDIELVKNFIDELTK